MEYSRKPHSASDNCHALKINKSPHTLRLLALSKCPLDRNFQGIKERGVIGEVDMVQVPEATVPNSFARGCGIPAMLRWLARLG